MADLNGKSVLVTGADGFIGSHLVESLLDEGCRVRAFVMYNSFNSWGWIDSFPKDMLERIEVFPGDIRDPNGVREAMRGIDVVFHLAALIAIPFSYHSPDSYVDTNIKGTLNVLQAAREYKTRSTRTILFKGSHLIPPPRSAPIESLNLSIAVSTCRYPS
jgi:nucleoside-diphosphate-sugar epimerase